jgi:ubiquinone/menaquinone biosynthesis C-methylase UbiE
MTIVRKTRNKKNKKYVTGVPCNPAYFVKSTQEPRIWPFLSRFLRTKNKALAILDVGCGSGSVLLGLFNDGYKNVWGIEYSEELCKLIVFKTPSMRILTGSAENLKDFNECFFDVVYCCAVLEHLPNPDAAVGEAFRVLKKGGAYIINVPNG